MRRFGWRGSWRREFRLEQAHYTHQRISGVLKLEYASVPADRRGRMDLDALEVELRKGDVGTVVATLGTTAMGAVDPLEEILALREHYKFRVHVDAAYGGYFALILEDLDEPARRSYAAMVKADSIVIDPHKHGLQPYGCGCVLFRDPAVGRYYKHDSPYTYFTSKQLHLGEISLECSRAGAAAVALWATQRLLPLVPGGEFARGLAKGRAPHWSLIGGCARTPVCGAGLRDRRNWTLWCGHWHCMQGIFGKPQTRREVSSRGARREACTWLLYNCRGHGLRKAAPKGKRAAR